MGRQLPGLKRKRGEEEDEAAEEAVAPKEGDEEWAPWRHGTRMHQRLSQIAILSLQSRQQQAVPTGGCAGLGAVAAPIDAERVTAQPAAEVVAHHKRPRQ